MKYNPFEPLPDVLRQQGIEKLGIDPILFYRRVHPTSKLWALWWDQVCKAANLGPWVAGRPYKVMFIDRWGEDGHAFIKSLPQIITDGVVCDPCIN